MLPRQKRGQLMLYLFFLGTVTINLSLIVVVNDTFLKDEMDGKVKVEQALHEPLDEPISINRIVLLSFIISMHVQFWKL